MAYQQNNQNQGGYYQQAQQTRRTPSFWHQVHREMMDCLLRLDRIDDRTRDYIGKLQAERSPTNNMKSALVKIFAEKFHRPNKPYTIEPWQPRQDASGYQPPQQQYRPRQQGGGQPQQRPQYQPRQQPAPPPRQPQPPQDPSYDEQGGQQGWSYESDGLPPGNDQPASITEGGPDYTPGEAAPMTNDNDWMNQ